MLPATLYGQLAITQQQSAAALSDPIVQAALANSTNNNSNSSTSSNDTTPTGSRDTTFTKIFVGGLPYHTTDNSLNDYFKQFGEIEEAVVITDRQTQKSRGYGFVTMKERSDAEKACKDPNPIIDGRKANVNLAYLGAKPRNNIHLAALSSSLQQLPLQAAQLQAAASLLPSSRIGIPQLYFPNAATAAALMQNALLSNVAASSNSNSLSAAQFQPAFAAAAAAAQAQHLAAVSQTNSLSLVAAAAANPVTYSHQHLQQHNIHHQQQQTIPQFDYAAFAAATAAAASAQNSNAFNTITPGLEQYGYQLSMLPGTANSAYAAQLSAAAAQAQLAVAASGAGHTTLDNTRV